MAEPWPALPYEAWAPTLDTLHMWTQVVGKVRLALNPYANHWWHVPLYVSARGLTTTSIPCGNGVFEMTFDFISHQLVVLKSDGAMRTVALAPRTVADFYAEVMATLKAIDVPVRIWTMPQEFADPIPFDRDTTHASYDAEAANRFWRVLLSVEAVLKEFRGEYLGKSSPVHFFWGGFDLGLRSTDYRTVERFL